MMIIDNYILETSQESSRHHPVQTRGFVPLCCRSTGRTTNKSESTANAASPKEKSQLVARRASKTSDGLPASIKTTANSSAAVHGGMMFIGLLLEFCHEFDGKKKYEVKKCR